MCFSILADLPSPDSYQAIGWLFVAGGSLMIMANSGVDLWRKMFPKEQPPAHELYATKAEVAKLEMEHEGEMQRIEKRFEEWMEQQATQHQESMAELRKANTTFGEWQRSIERALGHVETKADVALGKKKN